MEEARIHLTDKDIVRLPYSEKGQRVVRDTELKGFFMVIGRKTKTFTVQGDLRTADARKTIRVTVGEAADMTTRDARALAKGYLSEIARGVHPKPEAATRRTSDASDVKTRPVIARPGAITLSQAWERYRDAHMVRKGRSEKTISDYGDHVGRIFAEWTTTALKDLAEDPAQVAAKHDEITQAHGPYMANVAMRTLRAIYNHAMKSNPSLPGRNQSRQPRSSGGDGLTSYAHTV